MDTSLDLRNPVAVGAEQGAMRSVSEIGAPQLESLRSSEPAFVRPAAAVLDGTRSQPRSPDAPAPIAGGRSRRSLAVVALRGLLALEVVAIGAAITGSAVGAGWTADAVGLALTLPMAALALSSAVDVSERRGRR